MKALVLKEYNRFSFEEVPDPVPAQDSVLIAVKACGICGSDVHGMDGSTGRRRPPIIMGHEASGTITATGSSVSDWKPGDRVTFDSTVYCGKCDFCRSGQINLCDNRRVLGVSCEDYRQHGAFAEFVSVPARVLARVPDRVPFEHAALVEPLSIAFHAVQRSAITPQSTVVVVGAGMIGLLVVQALRLAGCNRIIAVDVMPDKLRVAATVGAHQTVDSSRTHALDEINRLTDGRGADVAIEAVGLKPTVDLAVRCVRKGGGVTLVGNVAPQVELPLQVVVTRELTLQGSCASCGEYPACLEAIATGAIDPAPLISAIAPLSEGPEWFSRLHRREPGLLKVILKP